MKFKKYILPIGIVAAIGFAFYAVESDSSVVYVQASKGSFNDAAITKLFSLKPKLKSDVEFSGTPKNAFKQADDNNQLAFAAVTNSTITGNLVRASVEAVQEYKIIDVKALISIPIEMCVLMSKSDIDKGVEIKYIASHPAALKQISGWKAPLNAEEIAVPEGTAAAAEKVSNNKYPEGTAAIGSCVLESTYPNISVVAKAVQDNKNNNTSFLLAKVEKRDLALTELEARRELNNAISSVNIINK
ncbi:prephenate dehydratase [Moritella sp. 36]|uniref:prephenate dehydratase domain-containing protein n=1 Tax=Moritella sp. 36 TaxID=2746233 RepID=UPI001BAA4643|nr:prephenate dehydratase domain-containing protein [Moritella sp. 36]QUM90524.1 prephenate dehydratase [Moritella sp. 36]